MSAYIDGIYQFNQSKLSNEHLEFIISKRKEITPKKSPYFLLVVGDDGKRYYVSSLYRSNERCYNFDYDGVDYSICIEDDQAEIVEISRCC